MESVLTEKAIKGGHTLASKIRTCQTVSDIGNLYKEIDEYANFIDDNFGVENGFSDEKECTLSMSLYVAVEEKLGQLKYHPEQNEAGNVDIDSFEEMLDSPHCWMKK